MKNSPLTKVLLAISAVSVLLSLVICWLFIMNAKQLRYLQSQVANANNTSARVNATVTEAIEYSKKNPAINPLLESIGAKPGGNPPPSGATPATGPASRPSTK